MKKYRSMRDIVQDMALHGKTVFSVREVARVSGKSDRYASKLLSTYKGVERVSRGVYRIKGPGGADVYEVASNIIFPSYVSMFAALQFHSLTEQSVIKYSVISIKRHANVSFHGNEFEFITYGRARFFGYKKVGNAYVATVEKAIIDSLYMGSPDFDEVESAFSRALERNQIDVGLLLQYSFDMDSRVLEGKILKLIKRHVKDMRTPLPGLERAIQRTSQVNS